MTRAKLETSMAQFQLDFGLPGCFGCIDCIHIPWANCPTSWAGSATGLKGKPTLVLQAVTDNKTKFLDLQFGAPGTANDISVWQQSPLKHLIAQNKLPRLPQVLGGQERDMPYLLGDDIYPKCGLFAKGFSNPVNEAQKIWTRNQESFRKPVECSFGMTHKQFKAFKQASRHRNVKSIKYRTYTCATLHNLCVDENQGCVEEVFESLASEDTTDSDQDSDEGDGNYSEQGLAYLRESEFEPLHQALCNHFSGTNQ